MFSFHRPLAVKATIISTREIFSTKDSLAEKVSVGLRPKVSPLEKVRFSLAFGQESLLKIVDVKKSFNWPSAKRILTIEVSLYLPLAKIFSTKDSQGQTKIQLAFCQKNLIKREFNFNWPLAKMFSTKDS